MFSIRAQANCDHAFVVWLPDKPIEDCLGFALYRQVAGKPPEVVDTFVGPKTETKVPAGTKRPSTKWPIQKFMWSDYLVGSESSVRYQVVAMCGTEFDDLKPGPSSPWSNSVSLINSPDAPIQSYFNRGVVSTQWMARQLQSTRAKLIDLVNCKLGTSNPTRDFLGGSMKTELLNLLKLQRQAGGHIYASLFELNDPEVLPALAAFGQRAHIILSDGTHQAPKKTNSSAKTTRKPATKKAANGHIFDENAAARATLHNAHVELHDRMVKGNHFAHHKFIVLMDLRDSTKPTAVWTGSMNLTYGGVCTQANNSVLIKSPEIAQRFFQQWKTLVKAGDNYPASLIQGDAHPESTAVGGATVTAWFAPNPPIGGKSKQGNGTKYGDRPDLKSARQLIQNAQEGILFLVFNPGPKGTLLNDILALLQNPTRNSKLYIHGVANQDPAAGPDKQALIFVHRNKVEKTLAAQEADIVLPAAIAAPGGAKVKDKAAAKALSEWVKKVNDYWLPEPTGLGIVCVHSKVIVIDPFGKHPVIITGSHNLGPKASDENDDNMVIIENDPETAAQYAVNIQTVYDQYRWCFSQAKAAKEHTPLNQWNGLLADWKVGQATYFSNDDKRKEIAFWLG